MFIPSLSTQCNYFIMAAITIAIVSYNFMDVKNRSYSHLIRNKENILCIYL